jgi:non-ribosomal peptide synthetase component F
MLAVEDARPTVIITREDGLGGVETRAPTMRVIQLTGLPKSARECWRPARLGLDEPACVLFTSGSTGRPKGIVNSQRNLLQRVAQSINAAHINAEDRFLTLASPCTIVGVRDVMTALLAGASIHLLDPQGAGAREILNAIRAEAITILFAFPALLRPVVAASAEHAGVALRLVRVGGDTTLWSDIDLLRGWLAPGAEIQLIYAATEAPMLQWFVDDSCRGEDARIPIGYPLPGNRLAIIDEDGRTTPRGEVGELIVASHTCRWDVGSMDVVRTRALKPAARAHVDFFERETSCAKGRTGCWSESAARTGKSSYAASALISTAWKPRFASTLSYETSLRWRERAASMAR